VLTKFNLKMLDLKVVTATSIKNRDVLHLRSCSYIWVKNKRSTATEVTRYAVKSQG